MKSDGIELRVLFSTPLSSVLISIVCVDSGLDERWTCGLVSFGQPCANCSYHQWTCMDGKQMVVQSEDQYFIWFSLLIIDSLQNGHMTCELVQSIFFRKGLESSPHLSVYASWRTDQHQQLHDGNWSEASNSGHKPHSAAAVDNVTHTGHITGKSNSKLIIYTALKLPVTANFQDKHACMLASFNSKTFLPFNFAYCMWSKTGWYKKPWKEATFHSTSPIHLHT